MHIRPSRPLPPDAAPEGTSPFPPRLQLKRHIRDLLRKEKSHMCEAKPGSEERRLHKKYTGYFARYERILEDRSPHLTRSANHSMDGIRQAGKADLARLQADLKPVDAHLRQAETRLSGLEKDRGALKERLRVLGAQAKGDIAPVRFTGALSHTGATERKAFLETGKPRGVMALFRLSKDPFRLTAEDARSRLALVEGDIVATKATLHSTRGEREAILSRPRYEPPRFSAVELPKREELLQALHDSQPLRRKPFRDPLAPNSHSTAEPPQGPSILQRTGPGPVENGPGSHGAESPLGITPSEAAAPRVHPKGGKFAGLTARTMTRAMTIGSNSMSGANSVAGALNTGVNVGVLPMLPPVEPISISLTVISSAINFFESFGAHRRVVKLEKIQANLPTHIPILRCDSPGPEHDRIVGETLPYIIAQQKKIVVRKGVSTVPVLGGLIQRGRGIYTYFQKKRAGTLGVERKAASNHLAEHLVTHHCDLAEETTSALFGPRRMEALRGMEQQQAYKAIKARLKST